MRLVVMAKGNKCTVCKPDRVQTCLICRTDGNSNWIIDGGAWLWKKWYTGNQPLILEGRKKFGSFVTHFHVSFDHETLEFEQYTVISIRSQQLRL